MWRHSTRRTPTRRPRSPSPPSRDIDFTPPKTVHWPQREGRGIQPAESIRKHFDAALDGLVAQMKPDRSVLAAILCGSLSHATVWAKSDIALVLVTIDGKKLEKTGLSLYADGVNVHAFLLPRAEFRQSVEG